MDHHSLFVATEHLIMGFGAIARTEGVPAAERAATTHLVAAVSYLKVMRGKAKTLNILKATIKSADLGQPGIN